jgi:hypothetical protein
LDVGADLFAHVGIEPLEPVADGLVARIRDEESAFQRGLFLYLRLEPSFAAAFFVRVRFAATWTVYSFRYISQGAVTTTREPSAVGALLSQR